VSWSGPGSPDDSTADWVPGSRRTSDQEGRRRSECTRQHSISRRHIAGLAVLLALLGCATGDGAPDLAIGPRAGGDSETQVSVAEQTVRLRVRILTSGDPAPTRPPMPTISPAGQPLCPGAMWWHDARKHVGRHVTVEGPVVEVRYPGPGTSGRTLVALGQPYADPNRFTIRLAAEFPLRPALHVQRTVCATGHVERLEGTPAMDVDDPSALMVLERGVEEATR
jgi:hypothetical protein